MLTHDYTFPKLEQTIKRYQELRFVKVADIPVQMCQTTNHFRRTPTLEEGASWSPVSPGTKWGGNGLTAWFAGEMTLPTECSGKRVFIRSNTDGETLFFVNDEPRGVFDGNHCVVMLTSDGVGGENYRLSFEAYPGQDYPGCHPHESPYIVPPDSRNFGGFEVVVEREDVKTFLFDLRVLLDLAGALGENTLRKNRIARELAKVLTVIVQAPQDVEEQVWQQRLSEALEIMRPLLEARNGSTSPFIGLTGHSHLDTAWLWPIRETWRKAARTFSSVVNLMDQYPEFRFIQSSPYQTEMIRQKYPALFERIKEKVAEGRWEPNGAMWVEPDMNIPTGEALVRQLIVGQAWTREQFGYTADTLWLPDVFGYSASLPQILRGAGVEYFSTMKLFWNDTARFPYDTFVWKGIDGTPVISHLLGCFMSPDPKTLTDQWNWVQHKDIQDRQLLAYGYGDGGGGPVHEQIEFARRVQDLEGCPRAAHTSVSDFMKSIRTEMPDLPEWLGELYYEDHRGTLTSVARIKRANRKTEIALREAEFLSTAAYLLGAEYPAEELSEVWKVLLTNQFHDILPGTSIAEVNDEALSEFEDCLKHANDLSKSAVKSIAGTDADARHILITNSLSWDRNGEMVLEGIPQGMRPADDSIKAQRMEDVQGRDLLVVNGIQVPALGSTVLALESGDATGDSPFKVGEGVIETPWLVMRFDDAGRVFSCTDKTSGRELVKQGGMFNTFLIGEDVPRMWDNWNIDADQFLNMREDHRLVQREVVAYGPLQLRVRSEYKIGVRSSLVQDMVFHSDSPRVDFETAIDWAEKHQLLKASFDLDIFTGIARHEIQFGHIERPTHGNLPQDRAKFEVSNHKWTDLSDGGFGVAVLNDCKYGISVSGGEVGLTLMKSGMKPDTRADEGIHYFNYSILPHSCAFSVEAVVRPAYELNIPVKTFSVGENTQGFDGILDVDVPNVIVESIKQAENGNGFIVRLYEAGKACGEICIRFNVPVKSVTETNLLEETIKDLGMDEGCVRFFMRPFEIKTLFCTI